jgi:hypothetical protein
MRQRVIHRERKGKSHLEVDLQEQVMDQASIIIRSDTVICFNDILVSEISGVLKPRAESLWGGCGAR